MWRDATADAGRIWVLVADAARARGFAAKTAIGTLTELGEAVHPSSQLRNREIDADAPGRGAAPRGEGRHAVAQHHVDPHEEEARRFARELADELDRARKEGRFDRLVLVAPPAFLGALREAFPEPLKRTVANEIQKELTRSKPDEIREKLPYRI